MPTCMCVCVYVGGCYVPDHFMQAIFIFYKIFLALIKRSNVAVVKLKIKFPSANLKNKGKEKERKRKKHFMNTGKYHNAFPFLWFPYKLFGFFRLP